MKLVIQTQYCENYGDAQKPHWKFKGGETYVVANLTDTQAQRIKQAGIPTLKSLIEYKNDFSEEYVTHSTILPDDAVVCDEWESPRMLSWEKGQWVCREAQNNEGMFRRPIVSRISKYTLLQGGEKGSYECFFEVEGGALVSSGEFEDFLKSYDEA